jgi:predicted Zn-dependent peptidase
MSRLAKNEIYFGRDIEPEEIAQAISAVTAQDVVAVAEDLFRPEEVGVTLLGDLRPDAYDESLLSTR